MHFVLPFLTLIRFTLAAPRVRLGNTTVTGTDISLSKQDFFGGLRFAQAPVKQLRFAPPVPIGVLNVSTFDATQPGIACLQTDLPTSVSSEDCLTLDIFRPSGIATNAKLPVMVWLFGGGWFQGSASWYNGSALVSQSMSRGTPIIHVSINYRLGPLGYPQGAEAEKLGALNLGQKDQFEAFQWIQRNIEAFGGDKTKVTLYGQSAGAVSIAIHYLNPSLSDVAHGAIMESGSAATPQILNATAANRIQGWQDFVGAVPACASVATSNNTFKCMQGDIDPDTLLSAIQHAYNTATNGSPFLPTIDGEGGVYPDFPSSLFSQGKFARIPFITGDNLDEGTLFVLPTTNSTEDIHDSVIAMVSPNLAPETLETATQKILSLYPDDPTIGSPYNTGNDTFGLSSQYKRWAAIYGDIVFHSLRRSWIQTASDAGVKTYGYLFTDSQLFTTAADMGVNHNAEVGYVFTWLAPGSTPPSSLGLASKMRDYWISFATSLDPNDGKGNSRVNWTQYTPRNQLIIQLNGSNATMIPDTYRSEQISYINSKPKQWNH